MACHLSPFSIIGDIGPQRQGTGSIFASRKSPPSAPGGAVLDELRLYTITNLDSPDPPWPALNQPTYCTTESLKTSGAIAPEPPVTVQRDYHIAAWYWCRWRHQYHHYEPRHQTF